MPTSKHSHTHFIEQAALTVLRWIPCFISITVFYLPQLIPGFGFHAGLSVFKQLSLILPFHSVTSCFWDSSPSHFSLPDLLIFFPSIYCNFFFRVFPLEHLRTSSNMFPRPIYWVVSCNLNSVSPTCSLLSCLLCPQSWWEASLTSLVFSPGLWISEDVLKVMWLLTPS